MGRNKLLHNLNVPTALKFSQKISFAVLRVGLAHEPERSSIQGAPYCPDLIGTSTGANLVDIQCQGQDSNLGSLAARVLQTRAFDHSATLAFISIQCIKRYHF